jgi:hypothetical protein
MFKKVTSFTSFTCGDGLVFSMWPDDFAAGARMQKGSGYFFKKK